jgi:hypothetical protein
MLLICLGLGVYYHCVSSAEESTTETLIGKSLLYQVLLELGPPVSFFVSLVLLLIPALGFFGSYKENTWLLISFGVLMVINSCIKGVSTPRNPFLGFASTLFFMMIPFVLTSSFNARMSRAI